MMSEQTSLTEAEIAQIEEHKYFLSEKAGYDVGWEFAEQDWRENVADSDLQQSTTEDPAKGIGGLFRRLFSKAAL